MTRLAPRGWLADLAGRPVIRNAASLFGATIVTSVLGFGFSVFAARLYPISETGIAFPALSAMQLLGQLGLIGIGTMLIGQLATGSFPSGLVSAGAITATFVAFILGVAYIFLQSVLNTHLGPFGHGVLGPALFAAGVAITSLTLVLDQATVGLGKSTIQLLRNGVFAVVKLLLLPLGTIVPGPGAILIYITWFIGNVVSLVPYWRAVRRAGIKPVLKPHFRALHGERWTVAAHHWLNIADQAPRLLLPVLVATLLGGPDAAAFYTANLLVAFVTIVPVHLTTALFALPRGQLNRLADEARATLRLSLTIGVVGAVVTAALADPMLWVFGKRYVIAAASMAVLGTNVLPYTIKVHYASLERVRGRLTRCATVSTIGAAVEIGLSIAGAKAFGLVGVSAGFVAALFIEAVCLWPAVAHGAQVPVLGIPTWLWKHKYETPTGSAAEATSLDGLESAVAQTLDSAVAGTAATALGVGPVTADLGAALLTFGSAKAGTRRSASRRDLRSASGTQDAQMRPLDPMLLRIWLYRQDLLSADRSRRVRARVRLVLLSVKLLRRRSARPAIRVTLSSTAAGETLSSLTSMRLGPFTAPKLSQFVLELPESITAFEPTAPTDLESGELRLVRLMDKRIAAIAHALCEGRSPGQLSPGDERLRPVQALSEAFTIAVLDDTQTFVSVGTVLADHTEAYLVSLVSRPQHPDCDQALTLVHDALVMSLILAGVKRLWTDGASETEPRRQRFQRDVGYKAAVLRLSSDESGMRTAGD